MKLRTSVAFMEPTDPLTLSVDEDEISLIKGLHAGTLDQDQQRQAFDIIIKKFCRMGGISLSSEAHLRDASEGMRLVGKHLLHIVETPFDKLIQENL